MRRSSRPNCRSRTVRDMTEGADWQRSRDVTRLVASFRSSAAGLRELNLMRGGSSSPEKGKGMFSYSEVSSPSDRSKGKHFTLHPLAELFIPTSTRVLWEAFSHAAITAQGLCIHCL